MEVRACYGVRLSVGLSFRCATRLYPLGRTNGTRACELRCILAKCIAWARPNMTQVCACRTKMEAMTPGTRCTSSAGLLVT